jgi:hypothetical protein
MNWRLDTANKKLLLILDILNNSNSHGNFNLKRQITKTGGIKKPLGFRVWERLLKTGV